MPRCAGACARRGRQGFPAPLARGNAISRARIRAIVGKLDGDAEEVAEALSREFPGAQTNALGARPGPLAAVFDLQFGFAFVGLNCRARFESLRHLVLQSG